MIALSADATVSLRQDGVALRPKVSIGAPVSRDISWLVSSIPVIRSSVRPLERTPDISTLSIRCQNPDSLLSEWNASGWIGSQKWAGALVTVSLGIPLAAGGHEDVTVFVGDLEDVIENFGAGTVELLCVDPVSRLKRYSVDGDNDVDVYVQEAPSYIVQQLLTAAGFGSRLTGFAARIDEERWEGFRLREYTVPQGSWWSAIQGLLRQVNAGLRVNRDGDVEYFKYRPTVEGTQYVFRVDQPGVGGGLQSRAPRSDIVNTYTARRENFEGETVDTAASPIVDAQSVTDYGTIGDIFETGFPVDFPAEATVREFLPAKSQPPRLPTFQDSLQSLAVELWDQVQVQDPETGYSAVGVVFEKSIEYGRGVIGWRVYDYGAGSTPWLFVENGQTLDSGQVVW